MESAQMPPPLNECSNVEYKYQVQIPIKRQWMTMAVSVVVGFTARHLDNK